jgi:ribulose-phosphate 3-epimerase
MKFYISPSIISADFTKITEEITKIESFEDSFVHLDIMDGNFVPNITFGPFIVEQIRNITKLPFDTHLMIKEPDKYIESFIDAGSDFITFHIEESSFPLRILEKIKKLNKKCGISLNPATPVEHVVGLLPFVDIVLVMSVEPGFSGQSFIESSLERISFLRNFKEKNNLNYLISVDGGINDKNILKVLEAGANVLVMGNFFFKNDFSAVKNIILKYREC